MWYFATGSFIVPTNKTQKVFWRLVFDSHIPKPIKGFVNAIQSNPPPFHCPKNALHTYINTTFAFLYHLFN